MSARELRKRKREEFKESNANIYKSNKMMKLIKSKRKRKADHFSIERSFEQYNLFEDYLKYRRGDISIKKTQLACFICSRGTNYVFHYPSNNIHHDYSMRRQEFEDLCLRYRHEDCIYRHTKMKPIILKYHLTQMWLIDSYYLVRYDHDMKFYTTWRPNEICSKDTEEVLEDIKTLIK